MTALAIFGCTLVASCLGAMIGFWWGIRDGWEYNFAPLFTAPFGALIGAFVGVVIGAVLFT